MLETAEREVELLQTASMRDSDRPFRLLILTSHAIQYQAPLFRAMARDPRLKIHVALCTEHGAQTYWDPGFGKEVKWDIPLLEGFPYEVMANWSPVENPSKFFGVFNPRIIRLIRSGGFDAVLVHNWSSLTNWMAMLAAMFHGLPILLRAETSIQSKSPAWRTTLKNLVLVPLFRRISGFLAIGRFSKEFFLQYHVPEEKIFISPYAVDNDFFMGKARSLQGSRMEMRRAQGIADDVPIILFCGKLTDNKRPLDLLIAFRELTQQSAAALIFVGDGSLRNEMETWTADQNLKHVYFVGFQNQTELPRFLTMADIFVLPSAHETWGLVVNEAMCFSLPVVVSDRVAAGADLVRQGGNGFVFPVGDVKALTSFLGMLVENGDLRGRMGKESFRMIQNWSYQEDIAAIVECLERFA